MLDAVEFDRLAPAVAIARWRDRETPHPGVERWVTHAVTNVLAAEARIEGLPTGLAPVSRWWARQRPATTGEPGRYEETVHGRRYENEDGVREIRLLRHGSVKNRPIDDREVAFAAGVVAEARPVLSNPWAANEFRLGRFEAPTWVRVVEVGCADASTQVLFSGTPQEALGRYASDVADSVGEAISARGYRPGEDCGRCVLVDVCPAVPSLPGLLGVDEGSFPRRTWSVTTGRTYRDCPARAHFGRLFLPGDRAVEGSDAVRRGRAVHHWIEQRHRAVPHTPCRASDVPEPTESWYSGGWKAMGVQARLGSQMIGDHALVCPIRGLPADAQVLPEHSIVVFDPAVNVVVRIKADLLYQDDEGWVLREVKTQRVPSHGELFQDYPQLALAVVLSASGVLAEGKARLRVELERLTSRGPILTRVNAGNPAVLSRSRTVLTGLVEDWLTDTVYPTRPGRACRDCPYARWCPDASKGQP
ncbi:PD-(D/E)XK nuclease family protein [Crossiella sp. NPDC003009]